MTKLALSVAIGDYDRTRALIDGSVGIDGVDPIVMTLAPEEIFFRAFRHGDKAYYDVAGDATSMTTSGHSVPASASRTDPRSAPWSLSASWREG